MQAVNLPLGGSWRAIRPLRQVQSKRLRTRMRGGRDCCPPEHLALGSPLGAFELRCSAEPEQTCGRRLPGASPGNLDKPGSRADSTSFRSPGSPPAGSAAAQGRLSPTQEDCFGMANSRTFQLCVFET